MTRRGFVLGLAAAAAALPLSQLLGSAAIAQRGQSFGRIVVDTKPLTARGGGFAANALRPRLQQSLQSAFAGRIGRGPTLVARIHSITLSSYAGGGGGYRGGPPSDFLQGELVIGGDVVPLLVTQSADSSGAWYAPDNELRRLNALADAFASWAARRV